MDPFSDKRRSPSSRKDETRCGDAQADVLDVGTRRRHTGTPPRTSTLPWEVLRRCLTSHRRPHQPAAQNPVLQLCFSPGGFGSGVPSSFACRSYAAACRSVTACGSASTVCRTAAGDSCSPSFKLEGQDARWRRRSLHGVRVSVACLLMLTRSSRVSVVQLCREHPYEAARARASEDVKSTKGELWELKQLHVRLGEEKAAQEEEMQRVAAEKEASRRAAQEEHDIIKARFVARGADQSQ